MYTRFILFGCVTSNCPSDLKSSCELPAQCPPPPLVPSTQEVAMVRERDVPDGRLTSSNGSVWPPSHYWHSVTADSLSTPWLPWLGFFHQCFVDVAHSAISGTLQMSPLAPFFLSRLFDTEDFSGTLQPVGRLTYCDSVAFPWSLCFLNVSYSPSALSQAIFSRYRCQLMSFMSTIPSMAVFFLTLYCQCCSNFLARWFMAERPQPLGTHLGQGK